MSNIFQSLSNDLAATVETAGSGVVRVEARRRLSASGIVWSQDGVIVTSHHGVERDENIKIGLPNGQSVSATLVGRDPTTDLAVLRAEATGLTPATWVDFSASPVQVGHLMLALGRPGKSVQATLGIITALSQDWRTPGGGRLDHFLQTDVVMYPGFSGGPLVNAAGHVIGMNTSALLRGISFTVSAPSVQRVVEMLLAHGHIKRGYLGVSTQPVRLPAALSEQLKQETGLLLVAVEPDSPADKGGLLLGDTIVSLADSPVRQHDALLTHLSGDKISTEITLKIVRGGQITVVTAVVGERD